MSDERSEEMLRPHALASHDPMAPHRNPLSFSIHRAGGRHLSPIPDHFFILQLWLIAKKKMNAWRFAKSSAQPGTRTIDNSMCLLVSLFVLRRVAKGLRG